jgi:hypothetical protein
MRAVKSSGQPCHSLPGNSGFVGRNGRQGRSAVAALFDVVETHHGDVVGDPEPLFPKGMDGAEGEEVVEAEDGVRRIAELEELQGAVRARLPPPVQ